MASRESGKVVGQNCDPASVHVDDEELSPEAARTFGLHLLAAAQRAAL